MKTKETLITTAQLLERWGITISEIKKLVRGLFNDDLIPLANPSDSIERRGIPWPFRGVSIAWTIPESGKIMRDIEPILDRYGLDEPEGYLFLLSEIEYYEKYATLGPDDPEMHNAYISAGLARALLKMSPVAFVRYLRENRESLPLARLTSSDREYFYKEGTSIEEIATMLLPIEIHRLDWENHLKALAGPAEAGAPVAGGEAAELRAKQVEVAAGYEAQLKRTEDELKTAKAKTISLKDELDKLRTSFHLEVGKQKETLKRWQRVLTWMIPAAIAVAREGVKPGFKPMRTPQLWPFVIDAGGPPKRNDDNEQFKAWRAALPPDLCDKENLDKKAGKQEPSVDG